MTIDTSNNEGIHPALQEQRGTVLKAFERPVEHATPVNIDRVNAFIRERGRKVKPVVLLETQEDIDKLKGLSAQAEEGLHNSAAYYDAELDLAVVRADYIPQEEGVMQDLKALATEATAIHEVGGHGNSGYRHYRMIKSGPQISRIGLAYFTPEGEPVGAFLEEGVADREAAEYTRRNLTSEMRSQIAGGAEVWPGTHGDIPIPVEYVTIDQNGNLSYPASAYAAYGVELLCKLDPGLEGVLVRAQTDALALQDTQRRIDNIRPGLYKELQEVKYETNEDFATQAVKVRDLYNAKIGKAGNSQQTNSGNRV